jgi:hypothetical protein
MVEKVAALAKWTASSTAIQCITKEKEEISSASQSTIY